MPIKTGNLRNSIQLQRQTTTKGVAGDDVTSWSTYATVWGEEVPENSREFYWAKQVAPLTTGFVRIRFMQGVAIQPMDRMIISTPQGATRTLQINGAFEPEGGRGREVFMGYSEYSNGV